MSILPEVLAFDPIVTDASGSIADVVGSRNQHGRYYRSRVTPTQPNTPSQVQARLAFGFLVKRWRTFLTDARRAAWIDWAVRTPRSAGSGPHTKPSGRDAYVACNMPRRLGGFGLVEDAPTGPRGVIHSRFTIFLQVIGGLLHTRGLWGVADPWQTTVGAFMQVQTSRIERSTVNYIRGPWHTGTYVRAFNFPPYTSDRDPITAFPNPRRAGRSRVCMPDGTCSPWRYAFTFTYHKP